MKSSTLHYTLLTYRLDHLYLPVGFLALFAIVAFFMNGAPQLNNLGPAFLGAVLPLISGLLSAYALLDDPALELQFATPTPPWRALLGRLAPTLVVLAITAVAYEGILAAFGFDWSVGGNLARVQLIWLIPSLTLMALGCAASLAMRQSTAGAMLVGLVWIVELLLRSWFASKPAALPWLIFLGMMDPQHPDLLLNQLCLGGLSLALLLGSWALWRQQERYL